MPPAKEIVKNRRERVRVSAGTYAGHELVDIRIYAPVQGATELVPTRRGVAVNVDTVPDLIAALEWSLAQDCTSETERPIMSPRDCDELANIAWASLGAHGSAVHWDAIEAIVKDQKPNLSKWDLHYVLATRRDLFQSCGQGTFRAIGYPKADRDGDKRKRLR